MNNTCQFIVSDNSVNSENSNNSCKHKCKYGGYCYKHRRNYLCNGKYIVIERFTNKESDYLKIFQ